MKNAKVTNLYGQTLTIQGIVDNIVKTYERPNDTIHASNLFLADGRSLISVLEN